MADINVKWSGLDKLMEELGATAEATIDAAASAMKTTTGQVQAKAKQILDYSPRYLGHEIASGRSESNVWSVANTD
ncbi:hypothetical protein [Lacticaseibacillus mingshuiensis]|uniref:Uncharacterized protein n=1 Tax=Lacticaseibacillus mingshuiensis TaxID=2799574 RepID=A0ABW4CKH8_9LACO